jgi:mannose/cellobiose epimerase-like protein (N-acyl-D-glucosamine 2-epimerase family)
MKRSTMTAAPAGHGAKRLRVLARQIYCFAYAKLLGWQDGPPDLLEHCFRTLVETGWHANGGWIHLWNADGTVKDPQRDTYDQCFVLLALAWLWRATKWPEARIWAERTIAYMDEHLVDRANGGFYESSLRLDFRRANPHMHYLEAMQAWYEVTGERAFLDRAQTAVDLFTDGVLRSRKLERDGAFRARLVGAQPTSPPGSSPGIIMNGSGCCYDRRGLPTSLSSRNTAASSMPPATPSAMRVAPTRCAIRWRPTARI